MELPKEVEDAYALFGNLAQSAPDTEEADKAAVTAGLVIVRHIHSQLVAIARSLRTIAEIKLNEGADNHA